LSTSSLLTLLPYSFSRAFCKVALKTLCCVWLLPLSESKTSPTVTVSPFIDTKVVSSVVLLPRETYIAPAPTRAETATRARPPRKRPPELGLPASRVFLVLARLAFSFAFSLARAMLSSSSFWRSRCSCSASLSATTSSTVSSVDSRFSFSLAILSTP